MSVVVVVMVVILLMIGMSSSNFLFKTFLSTSNTTFELLLHFFYIGGNMLPASILSFVFSSKNELYMVWAGRRDPWWGWLRGWEHAIWLGCYYLFRKQRKCLLTQLQIAPLPSLASLTVRIFSWGTKLKRDWESKSWSWRLYNFFLSKLWHYIEFLKGLTWYWFF